MSPQRHKFLALRVYRTRDAKAYDELCDVYMVKIRRYVALKLPRGEDADEVTGEVFLRGWEYMTANQVNHVGSFFFQIAKNLIADFYRSRKPVEALGDKEESVPVNSSLEVQLDAKDEVAVLSRHLRGLKTEHAEVLTLRFFNEMSVGEISRIVGKTPNAVRVLIFRARQALSKSLKKVDNNPSK
jgi:RNA polymerase sigma-70 factor (ECF subfamily)